MDISLRVLRRRLLTPDVSETSLGKRGFHKKNPDAQKLLETVGKVFVDSYGHAVEARSIVEVEERLETSPKRFRGFAYEGAAMGLGVLDGLPFGGHHRVDDLLTGRGHRHVYMVYVGIGWAMARLPKLRWPDARSLDPLLRWLVLDGYGFHQAYFHTRRYVDEQFQDPRFPWPVDGSRGYPNRAIDQGIGRALWFVAGTDAARVASMIEKFPAYRHGDLYGGAGLAATYAGGCDADELHVLRERAGAHRPMLAQGSAFAAEARVRASLLVPHVGVATEVLCGATPERAARITQDVRPDSAVDGELPAYEAWRQRIAAEFVSLGGVHT